MHRTQWPVGASLTDTLTCTTHSISPSIGQRLRRHRDKRRLCHHHLFHRYVQAELAASLRFSASLSCESRPLNSLKRRCRPNKHRRIGFPSERGCTLSFRGLAGRRAVAFYFNFCPSPKAKCAATVHGYHLDKPTRGGWKGRQGGKESSKRENSGACKGPQMKRSEGPIGEELRHSTAGL